MWGHMPVILTLGRLKQVDCEFKDALEIARGKRMGIVTPV